MYYVGQGWAGGSGNENFPLLYVMKMTLHRGLGGSKKNQNTPTYVLK